MSTTGCKTLLLCWVAFAAPGCVWRANLVPIPRAFRHRRTSGPARRRPSSVRMRSGRPPRRPQAPSRRGVPYRPRRSWPSSAALRTVGLPAARNRDAVSLAVRSLRVVPGATCNSAVAARQNLTPRRRDCFCPVAVTQKYDAPARRPGRPPRISAGLWWADAWKGSDGARRSLRSVSVRSRSRTAVVRQAGGQTHAEGFRGAEGAGDARRGDVPSAVESW